jgi:hypothetical protein
VSRRGPQAGPHPPRLPSRGTFHRCRCATRTEPYYDVLKGEPEDITRHRIVKATSLYGPSGVISLQDTVAFEGTQRGAIGRGNHNILKGAVRQNPPYRRRDEAHMRHFLRRLPDVDGGEMMGPRRGKVTAILVLIVLATACGDDGNGSTPGTRTALTREQLGAQIDDICKRTEAAFVEADEKYLGKYQTPGVGEDPKALAEFKEARSRMFTEAIVPSIDRALDEMDGLEPDEAARPEFDALVEAGRKGLETTETLLKRDPNYMDADEHPDPWEDFTRKTEALGVDSCAF